MKKWHLLQVSVISIPQLLRIYQRGSKVVVSKNVAAQSHEIGIVLDRVLDLVLEIAAESLTSDHLLNIPVPTKWDIANK